MNWAGNYFEVNESLLSYFLGLLITPALADLHYFPIN